MTDLADRLAATAPIYSHWPQLSALLQEAAAALRQWVSVDVRLPEGNPDVLMMCCPDPERYCPEIIYLGFWEKGGFYPDNCVKPFKAGYITHWMPLPSAPMMVEDGR